MKKAKIMLAAIAVFGIVGGALAFKANTTITFFKPAASGDKCTSAIDLLSTTTAANEGTYVLVTTNSTSTECGLYLTTFN